ncbi:MAG: response regulator [Parvularculaceae bacterium]
MPSAEKQSADPPSPVIAVVEDDVEIRELVAARLEADGFDPAPCADGAALDALLAERRVDLIVLDVMMPGEDGLSICRRLSASGGPPIIVASARGDDVDRIVGLEIGADDYLAKPFNPRELSARIRSVLRRVGGAPTTIGATAGAADDAEVYRFAGWRLDVDGRALADPDGAPVVLSAGEFSLLVAFARRPRRTLTRDQLLDWTRGEDSAPVDRAIDVQLSRLRKKLGDDPRNPALIKTVRGDGYLFAADARRERAR